MLAMMRTSPPHMLAAIQSRARNRGRLAAHGCKAIWWLTAVLLISLVLVFLSLHLS